MTDLARHAKLPAQVSKKKQRPGQRAHEDFDRVGDHVLEYGLQTNLRKPHSGVGCPDRLDSWPTQFQEERNLPTSDDSGEDTDTRQMRPTKQPSPFPMHDKKHSSYGDKID